MKLCIEYIIWFIINFRFIFFFTRSLPYAFESERNSWKHNLETRRVSCGKTEQIFASIGSVDEAQSNQLTRKALTEIEIEVRDCQSEIRRLDTNLSIKAWYSGLSPSSLWMLIDRATDPGRAVGVVDWRSAFDILIFLEFFSFISQISFLIFSAITLTFAGIYLCGAMKQHNKRMLLKTESKIWIYPMVLLKICFSKQKNIFRIVILTLIYLSAFTRFSNNSSVFIIGLEYFWCNSFVIVFLSLIFQILAVHATTVISRYKVKRAELALHAINMQIAETWTCEYLCCINRLSDLALLEVLKLAQLELLSQKGRMIVNEEISKRPFLMAISAMPIYKTKEYSYRVLSSYSAVMVNIQKQLGPIERRRTLWPLIFLPLLLLYFN